MAIHVFSICALRQNTLTQTQTLFFELSYYPYSFAIECHFGFLPFKRQSHKMVKYTQTIRLSVFDHFVNLALKGLRGLHDKHNIVINHVLLIYKYDLYKSWNSESLSFIGLKN